MGLTTRKRTAPVDRRGSARPRSTTCSNGAAEWIDAEPPDEVMASEKFVLADKLLLHGDQVPARDQRPAAPPDHRRRRAVTGVHLQHPARRYPPGRQTIRHLLDGTAGAGRPFDMEGGFDDVVLALSPSVSPTTPTDNVIASSNPTAASAPFHARFNCPTGRSRTSSPSCRRSDSG